jgi:hypothetical protein
MIESRGMAAASQHLASQEIIFIWHIAHSSRQCVAARHGGDDRTCGSAALPQLRASVR